MEDNKFFTTDELFTADGFQELTLDDLNSIAGGRKRRQSELLDYSDVTKKAFAILNTLNTEEEQTAYRIRYTEAKKRWQQDIANAPEDSADIYFSDYFKL